MTALHPTLAMLLIAYLEGADAGPLNDWCQEHGIRGEAGEAYGGNTDYRIRQIEKFIPDKELVWLCWLLTSEKMSDDESGFYGDMRAFDLLIGAELSALTRHFRLGRDFGETRRQTNWLKTELARLGGLEEV